MDLLFLFSDRTSFSCGAIVVLRFFERTNVVSTLETSIVTSLPLVEINWMTLYRGFILNIPVLLAMVSEYLTIMFSMQFLILHSYLFKSFLSFCVYDCVAYNDGPVDHNESYNDANQGRSYSKCPWVCHFWRDKSSKHPENKNEEGFVKNRKNVKQDNVNKRRKRMCQWSRRKQFKAV